MISKKHKAIFVHINKTGGTSIESIFPDKLLCSDQQTLVEIKNKILLQDWDQYFKFAFVRNPWDRMVSEYFFRKQSHLVNPKYWRCPEHLRIEPNVSFKEWVSMNHNDDIRFKSQVKWLLNENNNLAVDFIGRFENIEFDMYHVLNRLSMNVKLPHYNKINHNHYSFYYDKNTIEIVKERHQEDVDLFNYCYENKYLI